MATYLGFDYNNETGEIDAPCGCYQCNDSVQQGHYLCSPSPDVLVEDEGNVEGCYRYLNQNVYRWYVPLYVLLSPNS